MFDFWPVYSGERFRASWPSCYYKSKTNGDGLVVHTQDYQSGCPRFKPLLFYSFSETSEQLCLYDLCVGRTLNQNSLIVC